MRYYRIEYWLQADVIVILQNTEDRVATSLTSESFQALPSDYIFMFDM